jgi:tetratricopeptide (TPR) repeat protein
MNLEHRDDRENIEHDAFLSSLVRAWNVLAAKRWFVLGATAAVAVAALLVMVVVRANRLKEERAGALLNRATTLIEAERRQEAQPLLEKVRDQYDGTSAAIDARYFLGLAAVAADQLPQARKELGEFLSSHHQDDFMRAAAEGGLAVCLEHEKKWAEAAAGWTKAALVDEAQNFNAPGYLLNAALCWEQAGKPDEALKLLDRIIEKYPKSQLKTRVETIQARLKPAS